MVQLRRAAGDGRQRDRRPWCRPTLFLPQMSQPATSRSAPMPRSKPREGASIGEVGTRPQRRFRRHVRGQAAVRPSSASPSRSWRRAAVSLAGHADLKWFGLFITGVIFAVLAALRHADAQAHVRIIRSPKWSARSRPANSFLITSRSSTSDPASCAAPKCWCAGEKPDGTLVLPGSFIPLAEISGLIRAMTFDLMRRVCVEAGEAIGQRPALKISFNFAGMLFCRRDDRQGRAQHLRRSRRSSCRRSCWK